MDKEQVVARIKNAAAANGGRPPGRARFEKETGIRVADWYPHLWIRWGDALQEAGFAPNKLAERMDSAVILDKYIAIVRELGRVPLNAELKVKARKDAAFPSPSVFERFGGKAALLLALRQRCETLNEHGVLALLPPTDTNASSREIDTPPKLKKTPTGYVYLMQSGRHFKIGRSNSVGRREWELGIKIPVPPKTIHVIETDDPVGVEVYWHRRFAEKRGEGEWFNLRADDVAAFKRWKKIA
jgi:hypothetical protein